MEGKAYTNIRNMYSTNCSCNGKYFGCICNYITLTDKQLRRNPCTIYFFASSIVHFLILNFNLLSRWIHDGFLIDPKQTKSLFYCKFRNYFVIILPIISTSFLILASIHRWHQSSLNIIDENLVIEK